MPFVKLKVSRAGPAGAHASGDVIEVGAAERDRMVAAGQAVKAKKPTPPKETAAARRPAPETRDGSADQ